MFCPFLVVLSLCPFRGLVCHLTGQFGRTNPPPSGKRFLFGWFPNEKTGGGGPVLFLWAFHLEPIQKGNPPGLVRGSFDHIVLGGFTQMRVEGRAERIKN